MPAVPTPRARDGRLRLAAALALPLALAGCAGGRTGRPAGRLCTWVAGCVSPAFDPGGPPQPVRWALERLLSHGLYVADSTGHVTPAPGVTAQPGEDGRSWTFRLAADLRFTDDTPCTSREFREALERGLIRSDHGTFRWLLGSLEGMERVRAGRPLPAVGIETPDAATLVLRLARPDPRFPAVLALPGVGVPWRTSGGAWRDAVGLGPWRVARQDTARRLVLLRPGPAGVPDTLVVRFFPSAARTLSWLRDGLPDLVWPLPPAMARAPVPATYHEVVRPARPPRRLLLVMRADLPPTSRLEARHALAQSLNLDELQHALGPALEPPGSWVPGAPAFQPPSLDDAAVREWMDRAGLGRSFHVRMAYDADGVGADAARVLQGQWARLGIYVELEPLRGPALSRQLLLGDAHLVLVEDQPLTDGVDGALAGLVMPLRGPAVGSFRTGWRTREFDALLDGRPGPAVQDPALLVQRLDEELLAFPLGSLPWRWIERAGGGGAAFDPRFGPECVLRPIAAPAGR